LAALDANGIGIMTAAAAVVTATITLFAVECFDSKLSILQISILFSKDFIMKSPLMHALPIY
jgi:hypothetical protein